MSPPETPIPDLASYHAVVVNSSAGKDSSAMLDLVVELADGAACRDRLVVVHADLGRVEWPGTAELAARQAGRYGLRFEVVRRERGDLLHQVEHERGRWPDAARRYCTSDAKVSQIVKLFTRLTAELGGTRQHPVRILNCVGLRAEESAERRKKVPFGPDPASNGKRTIDRWLPLFWWPVAAVWQRIADAGIEVHSAYRDMDRLSCSFCVLAGRQALVRAAQLRPDLAAEYAAVEARIGHRFKANLSMADIIAAAAQPHLSQPQLSLFPSSADDAPS